MCMKNNIYIIILLFFLVFILVDNVYASDKINTSSTKVSFELNGGSILPEGYTLLEYIQSDGTQYIDTGISVSSNTKITSIISVEPEVITPDNESYAIEKDFNLIGTYGSWKGLALAVRLNSFRFWASSQKTLEQQYIEGVPYKIVLNDNGNFLVNDQVMYTNTNVTPLDTSILIFTAKHNSAPTGLKNGFMKLYEMTISEGEVLVSHLVPVRNEDNIVGLYDLVRGVFLTNLGIGDFVSGKVLDSYTKTYIDSTKIEVIPTPNKAYNTFLGWYQDSGFTIPLTRDSVISENIKTIYAKWQEHEHSYNELGMVNNQIGKVCVCGKIDTKNLITINIPSKIIFDGKTKEVSIINSLGLRENDYEVLYKIKGIDGTYKKINSLPKEIGDYIVILKYNGQEIIKYFKIVEEVENPVTMVPIFPVVLILFLLVSTILLIINKFNRKREKTILDT